MPVSSARLLSVAASQTDRPSCENSLLRGSKASGQLSPAAGRLQHAAAAAAGSLSTSTSKWGSWSGSSAGSGLKASGLFKAKVSTTPFDSIAGSSSSSKAGAATGGRSASVPRSHTAVFDAARGPAQAAGTPTQRTTVGPAAGQHRSISTDRGARAASSTRAAAVGAAGSATGPGLSTQLSPAAVPGRARVMLGRVPRAVTAAQGSLKPAPPSRPAGGSSSSTKQQLGGHAASVMHSGRVYSRIEDAVAAASTTASGITGSLGLLDRLPQQQQQQPPCMFEQLPAGADIGSLRPRAPDAAARLSNHGTTSSGAGMPGCGTAATSTTSSSSQQSSSHLAAGSSYLARLHLQRAATADAATSSSSSSGKSVGSAGVGIGGAGRRFSSAGAASSSSSSSSSGKQHALDALRAGRMRARALPSDAVTAPRSGLASAAAPAAGQPAPLDGAGGDTLSAAGCSGHSPQLQQQASTNVDSAVASLTALLQRLNSRKQELASDAQLAPQQLQQQQPTQPPPAQHSREQPQQQGRQQDDRAAASPVAGGGRATDAGQPGPGERLEFPALQPQQPQQPRSKSGSYLDIIRSSRVASKPQQQQAQRVQQGPQQPQLQTQQVAGQPQSQQYHPHMYQQQQQYQPGLCQPLQQQQQLNGVGHLTAALQRHAVAAASATGAQLLHTYRPHAGAASSSGGSSSSGGGSSSIGGALDAPTVAPVYRPPYVPPQGAGSSITRPQADSSQAHQAAQPPAAAAGSGPAGLRRQESASSWYTVSSTDADDAGRRCSSTGSAQQPQLQTLLQQAGDRQHHHHQQQQQHGHEQQVVLPHPDSPSQDKHHSCDSSSELPQQGFLISTQPMSEHSYDAAPHASSRAAAAAPGADQAAAAAVTAAMTAAADARHAFLRGSPASSSGGSEGNTRVADTAAAAVAADVHNRHTLASRSTAAAAAARVLAGSASSNSRREEQRAPASQAAVQRVAAAAAPDSDSDSDVSEMTCASLDSGSSSSSSLEVTVRVRSQPGSASALSAPQYPQQGRASLTAMQQAESEDGLSPGHGSRRALAGSAAQTPAAGAAVGPAPVKAYARSLSHRGAGLPRGCCGLRNQCNTCYQNSALQLLACVPELVGALLGPQAVQLFQGAAADAANNQHRGRGSSSTQQALTAAAVAAQAGVEWLHDAVVGPALQAVVWEMWGFGQQQQQQQQHGDSPRQQPLVARALPHQQQLQCVSRCMEALRSAMAETDPRWDDGDQWDCQEFCLALLQAVHNESNRVRGRPQYRELKLVGCEAQQAAEAAAYALSWEDSVVLDIFSWQLQSTMTCCSCGKASHAFDSAQELLVAIPPGREDVTLQECLARTTFSPEKMVGQEGYKCEACKALREATKQLQLFTYPQVLLLGLKRFETRGGSKGGDGTGGAAAELYSSRKVSTRVRLDAGDLLDLGPFCNPAGLAAAAQAGRPPPRYQLIAVADHTGCLNGGHYTARGRCVMDGSWVEFNDSLVLAKEPPSGSTREAYMMLYRLVG